MNLLLQLNGDLVEQFPGHERRLYVWACKKKACRRKQGSVRCFRGLRRNHVPAAANVSQNAAHTANRAADSSVSQTRDLGESLFGVKTPGTTHVNPFATSHSNASAANPFAAKSTTTATPAPTSASNETLPETFAQKLRVSSPPPIADNESPAVKEAWPREAAFPDPYPSYHVDADKEYLEAEPQGVPSNARLDRSAANGEGSSSAAEDKMLFESTMDKTFQRFADRLSQNPEQILRYEFAGQPLLYSRTDTVGKLLAAETEQSNAKVQTTNHSGDPLATKVPKCTNCGKARVFELQLTPHAITELEADDLSLEGMDWGTILLYVCSADCQEKGLAQREIGYLEEWVGVQWEEFADKSRR